MDNLKEVNFNNRFIKHFSGDDSGILNPRQTPGVLYSKALPTPVNSPRLIAWSEDLAAELELEKPENQQEIDILGGNLVTTTMYPYSACYGGHQFGNWAGQLGDGRAITLGEKETSIGRSWEFQLKGAGPTPYSRRADGRAVLRSSVREYLMSEAMHYLGVTTTRALSLVYTGDQVLRDMFYNGNPQYEPGAIVLRVAPSFLRFGNYEILAARSERENLKKLIDWTITNHFPHIEGDNKIILWFRKVVEKTASLMVEWQRVGFVHGVMNTDNMSILGLTIDYGPFAFLDNFDLDFTPNTTDLPGRRYAFGKQSSIAYWNLGCLAGAIASILPSDKEIIKELNSYQDIYWSKYYEMMGKKVGFDKVDSADVKFFEKLEHTLSIIKPDTCIFYQLLMDLPIPQYYDIEIINHFKESFYSELNEKQTRVLIDLLQDYTKRLNSNSISREESQRAMMNSNPRFILRNYLLSEAIEGLEKGDDTTFVKLQNAIKEPYSTNNNAFFAKRPDWATQKAGCSMLSCSS